jgi:hypothetical protein
MKKDWDLDLKSDFEIRQIVLVCLCSAKLYEHALFLEGKQSIHTTINLFYKSS